MTAEPDAARADDTASLAGERLAACYRVIAETAMKDVPICNPNLSVEAVGFRGYGERTVGIMITPWFMNLIALGDVEPASPGSSRRLRLPAGDLELLVGEVPGFGRVDACSLFSPMDEFGDQETVRTAAQAAIEALFDPETLAPPPPPPAPSPVLDRRALLRGRFTGEEGR